MFWMAVAFSQENTEGCERHDEILGYVFGIENNPEAPASTATAVKAINTPHFEGESIMMTS